MNRKEQDFYFLKKIALIIEEAMKAFSLVLKEIKEVIEKKSNGS